MRWAMVALLMAMACRSGAAPREESMSVHDLNVKDISGKDVSLRDFAGKALLIVNVASECGYTPQYAGLQELWERYRERGLVVLGFPSNDFGGQEPGTDAEIQTFCSSKFNVTFPLFSKVPVKGDAKTPLYLRLTAGSGEVKWNFTKFLVGPDGKVIQRFEPKVAPLDPALVDAVERALPAR